MTSLSSWWRRLIAVTDHLWLAHWPLLIGLLLMLLLRLPNFTEPYWYGDEGIYLTIGQSLRHGERLYAEIIDHKTPLIYYLAMVPNQLAFRWLLVGWMIVTTIAFYSLVKQWWCNRWIQLLTVGIFVLLTTLPRLEGNIPNGELFVMGFVLVGMWLISRTSWWHEVMQLDAKSEVKRGRQSWYLLAGAVLLSLGILTKVPGLFDAAIVGWAGWLAVWSSLVSRASFKEKWRELRSHLIPFMLLVGGIVLPILGSIVYFIARGSGSAYLDFGLLYNFRYAGSWSLPFSNPTLVWFFGLPGKALILAGILVVLTLAQKHLIRRWSWVLGWLALALFASTLSNRPYPHYFLQLVPPLALVIGSLLGIWADTLTSRSRRLTQAVTMTLASGVVLVLVAAVIKLLAVSAYPTLSYYQNWWQLVTRQVDTDTYQQRFNGIMADNNRATSILALDPQPYLFIWGTNPMLYAQSKKIPTGRFTVAFHIKDFQAYQETLDAVIERQPTYIVVMNDDAQTWPEFSLYLTQHYVISDTFTHFTLWQRLSDQPL